MSVSHKCVRFDGSCVHEHVTKLKNDVYRHFILLFIIKLFGSNLLMTAKTLMMIYVKNKKWRYEDLKPQRVFEHTVTLEAVIAASEWIRGAV